MANILIGPAISGEISMLSLSLVKGLRTSIRFFSAFVSGVLASDWATAFAVSELQREKVHAKRNATSRLDKDFKINS
jgi:hypothetical protein